MQFFKKYKFITFTSVGLFHELLAAIVLGVWYSPIKRHPGGAYTFSHGEKEFIAVVNNDSFLVEVGMFFVVSGFAFALIDHLLEIYQPRNNKRLIKWLKLLLGSGFVWAIMYALLFFVIFIKTGFVNE